jgi:atypical dual specificity phosphatase
MAGKKEREMSDEIIKELRFGVLDGYPVAGMGEPWASKLPETHALLLKNAIHAVLTLTEDDLYGKHHIEAGFLHLHIPIEDCEPPTVDDMDRAVAFIDECMDQGRGVAVHCLEGRGRTGTVLAAWLGKKEALNCSDAINRIHTLRHHTVLTPSQREFLGIYLTPEFLRLK